MWMILTRVTATSWAGMSPTIKQVDITDVLDHDFF